MSEKLRPCPFCGGEARIAKRWDDERNHDVWWIVCDECDMMTYESNTEEWLIEAWNRRANDGSYI